MPYPTSLPSSSPATHQVVNDEIVAIATELGVDPSLGLATVKDRLAAFSQAASGVFPYVTGRYYDGALNANSGFSPVTVSCSANQIRWSPFFCQTTKTFDRIGVAVTTAGTAATSARLGIFNMNTAGLPGTVVLDAGTVSIAAVANVELTISESLTGDTWYWLAYLGESTAVVRAKAYGAVPFMGMAALANDANMELIYSSFTYGVFTATPATLYSSSIPSPSIRLRAA